MELQYQPMALLTGKEHSFLEFFISNYYHAESKLFLNAIHTFNIYYTLSLLRKLLDPQVYDIGPNLTETFIFWFASSS